MADTRGAASGRQHLPGRARPRHQDRQPAADRQRACARLARTAVRATLLSHGSMHSGDLEDRPLGQSPPLCAGIAARSGYGISAGIRNPLPTKGLHVCERLAAAPSARGDRRRATARRAPNGRFRHLRCPCRHRRIPLVRPWRPAWPSSTIKRPAGMPAGCTCTSSAAPIARPVMAAAREISAAIRELGDARSSWPPTSGPRSAGRTLRIFSRRQCPDFVAKNRRRLQLQLLSGHRKALCSMFARVAVENEFPSWLLLIPSSS